MKAGVLVAMVACALLAGGEAVAAQRLAVPAGDGGSASLELLPPSGIAPLAGASARRRALPPRRGGAVRAAWPHRRGAHRPRLRLARWLARQTGPVAIRRRARRRIGSTRTPAVAAPRAHAAQTTQKLLLVRSFEIPRSDAAYATLSNYSWTYDNALAVFAFISNGDKANATQILDQLAALQRTDGSLDFAYDVATGVGAGQARAGSLAWVGLAAAAYKRKYASTRYDALIGGILNYVLALRTSDGLVKGGSDVAWVSTQHNLLTIGMLRDLADQLGNSSGRKVGSWTGAQLQTIHTAMGTALLSKTLVQNGSLALLQRRRGRRRAAGRRAGARRDVPRPARRRARHAGRQLHPPGRLLRRDPRGERGQGPRQRLRDRTPTRAARR